MAKSIGVQPMGIREWVPGSSIPLQVGQDVDEDAVAVEDAVVGEEEVAGAALVPRTSHRQGRKRQSKSTSIPCRSRLSGESTSGRLNKPRQTVTFLANMPSPR
jgi:hypothetical protein